MRSAKRMSLDFLFLLFHIAKWVIGICFVVSVYQKTPIVFWTIVFIAIGFYIFNDLGNVLKAIIKDTSLGHLDQEGELSYIKGMDRESLRAARSQLILYLLISTMGIYSVINNVSQWKEDGQNRFGNIAISSLLAAGPAFVLIAQAKKKD